MSKIETFSKEYFYEVLDDSEAPEGAETLILCSGQVYYDLLEKRKEIGVNSAAIVRLEQLYPFPDKQLSNVIKRYRQANDIAWVQEEPRNRGPWTFIREHIESAIGKKSIRYVGRKASASPATGSQAEHKRQLDALLAEAFEKARVLRKVG